MRPQCTWTRMRVRTPRARTMQEGHPLVPRWIHPVFVCSDAELQAEHRLTFVSLQRVRAMSWVEPTQKIHMRYGCRPNAPSHGGTTRLSAECCCAGEHALVPLVLASFLSFPLFLFPSLSSPRAFPHSRTPKFFAYTQGQKPDREGKRIAHNSAPPISSWSTVVRSPDRFHQRL
jgi:hypothetical protein